MSYKKGFTLIEIIVVMIIMAILACIAIPNYLNFLQQGAANSAEHNLISIYNAQQNYYLNKGYYCSSGTGCDTLKDINATLSLNINDSYFTYTCTQPLGAGTFQCTAANASNGISLTVTGGLPPNNTPIVLLGGNGCATPAGTCNPACTPPASPFCPTS